jgi:hypothetical protein
MLVEDALISVSGAWGVFLGAKFLEGSLCLFYMMKKL